MSIFSPFKKLLEGAKSLVAGLLGHKDEQKQLPAPSGPIPLGSGNPNLQGSQSQLQQQQAPPPPPKVIDAQNPQSVLGSQFNQQQPQPQQQIRIAPTPVQQQPQVQVAQAPVQPQPQQIRVANPRPAQQQPQPTPSITPGPAPAPQAQPVGVLGSLGAIKPPQIQINKVPVVGGIVDRLLASNPITASISNAKMNPLGAAEKLVAPGASQLMRDLAGNQDNRTVGQFAQNVPRAAADVAIAVAPAKVGIGAKVAEKTGSVLAGKIANTVGGAALGAGTNAAYSKVYNQDITAPAIIGGAVGGISGGLTRVAPQAVNELSKAPIGKAGKPKPVKIQPEPTLQETQRIAAPLQTGSASSGVEVPGVQVAQKAGTKPVEIKPLQADQSLGDTTRGFVNTVINDPNTPASVKKSISSLYSVRNTKDLQVKAANLVKSKPDVAMQIANNASDDTSVAVAMEMVKKLQSDGNIDQAVSLVENVAPKLTELGRAVQAASMYGKLTPEGILRFTQREINKFNQAAGASVRLEPTRAQKLVKMAENLQKMPEGTAKEQATAKLVSEAQQAVPSTLSEKLSTLQTMSQLLNPKTNIRNIGGNALFGAGENAAQAVGAGIDKALSKITGKRTTSLPGLGSQYKGFTSGGRRGIQEAYMGINTGPSTQYELNSVPVFRSGPLGSLEKTMNATLRGGDRAFYQAAFDGHIRMLQKLEGTTEVTSDMIEAADQVGKYRTFQDSNKISDFFVGLKKAFNKVGIGTDGKRFGLGDIVLKYPKTPANLLARGIDYSPAGFLKATYEVLKAIPDGQAFNQKAFVDSFSRAVVGSSSAFGLGFAMAKAGIITPAPEQNKNLRELQKTEGLGGYQINVSALKRWVLSGFSKDAAKLQKGDTLVSYDWAQPMAIPISAGAELGTERPAKAGKQTANAYLESANTLVEQPLLKGVQNFFGSNQGPVEALTGTLKDLPSSFVPTALNQINQLTDNTTRNTLSPSPVQEALNRAIAKVPIASQSLPAAVNVLGEDKQRYQNGSNNPFNVLLNPAFVNKYQPNQTADTALGLYSKTGETKQLPNTVGKSVQVNGQTVKLTGQQQSDLQRYNGERAVKSTELLAGNAKFQSLSDQAKVNLLSNLQTDIGAASKIAIMGDNPAKISKSVQDILNGNIDKAVIDKLNNADKTAKKVKVSKGKSSKGRKSGRKGKKGAAVKISPVNFSKTVKSGSKGTGSKSSGIKISTAPTAKNGLMSQEKVKVQPLKTKKIAITYSR